MNTFPATRDPASQRPTMSPDDRYAIPPLHRPFHRPPAAIWSETAGTLIDKDESAQVSIPARGAPYTDTNGSGSPSTASSTPAAGLTSTTFLGSILLIEDDAWIRNTLSNRLGSAGYRVNCAEDGQQGWEALSTQRFDLVITDHDMPRLTGVELLRRLRANWPDLPVILMSGKMPWQEPDLPQLLLVGTFLNKPFVFDTLLDKIRSLPPFITTADSRRAEPSWLKVDRCSSPLSPPARRNADWIL